jgi:predicted transposase/invertase (TIGR01784 family)
MIESKSGVLNPFVDWGFKHLFGTEKSKKNLIGFLNFLLGLEEHPIIDLRYLNNESIPLDKDGRECIFDILCEDNKGEKYLIEVQNAGIGYMHNRMVYYACRLIDRMGEKGREWNYDFNKIYSICIMNYTYEQNPVLRRDFKLCEPGTTNLMSDRLNFIMLQLPCLEKGDIEECDSFYEKLLYLLIQMKEGMKTIEELKQEVYEHGFNEHIREVFLGVLEDADVASLSPKERLIYDERLKRYRDNHACLDYAIETGIKQGIEQGIERGREQGLEQGMSKKSQDIAKKMKTKGMDYSLISEFTGLSVDHISTL